MQLDSFKGGVNTLVSAPRLNKDEAVQAKNLMLVEDGLWKTRWGSEYYGTDAGGSKVDGFCEYRCSNGTRELIIFANGLARKSTDGGSSWSTISGYTPTAGTPVQALQIGQYLYACNGTDAFSYYNGTSFSNYSEISSPANLTATRNTLGDGSYTYYYEVTAHNSIGETLASTEANETVDEERDSWSGDDAIDLDWDDVAGATYYTVYMGTATGYCEKITDVTVSSYKDDGSVSPNPYIRSPDDNTTGGPKFTRMCVSKNRLWATGNSDDPWTVYFTSKIDPNRDLVFSFAYGGGWIDLERGGPATCKAIVNFQDKPTVFCPTADGRGSIFQIDLTYNETWNFWDPSSTKITGQISSVAPRSVVEVENDIFFFTKRGVYILGNEPNITSAILRTNELSAKIRDYIQAIDDDDLDDVCAYYKDGKVFFSTPDRIFYYDRERLCWVKEWTTGVTQFGEHTDSSDITHFLGGMVTDGYLVKFSENIKGDLGSAFETIYESPRFPISKDWTDFAKIDKMYIRTRHPVGAMSITVSGTEKGQSYSNLLTETYVPGSSETGWNFDKWNTFKWNTTTGTPTTFSAESDIKSLRIKKRLRDLQFKITTSGLSSNYTLLGIIAEGMPIKTADPISWKLT